jgi:excisionase family DNA binding protein
VAKKEPVPVTEGTPPMLAEQGQVVYTIAEAAKQLGINPVTVREAIVSGELKAFLPLGKKDPRRTGPGLGWRIKREELQKWYFGS